MVLPFPRSKPMAPAPHCPTHRVPAEWYVTRNAGDAHVMPLLLIDPLVPFAHALHLTGEIRTEVGGREGYLSSCFPPPLRRAYCLIAESFLLGNYHTSHCFTDRECETSQRSSPLFLLTPSILPTSSQSIPAAQPAYPPCRPQQQQPSSTSPNSSSSFYCTSHRKIFSSRNVLSEAFETRSSAARACKKHSSSRQTGRLPTRKYIPMAKVQKSASPRTTGFS